MKFSSVTYHIHPISIKSDMGLCTKKIEMFQLLQQVYQFNHTSRGHTFQQMLKLFCVSIVKTFQVKTKEIKRSSEEYFLKIGHFAFHMSIAKDLNWFFTQKLRDWLVQNSLSWKAFSSRKFIIVWFQIFCCPTYRQ